METLLVIPESNLRKWGGKDLHPPKYQPHKRNEPFSLRPTFSRLAIQSRPMPLTERDAEETRIKFNVIPPPLQSSFAVIGPCGGPEGGIRTIDCDTLKSVVRQGCCYTRPFFLYYYYHKKNRFLFPTEPMKSLEKKEKKRKKGFPRRGK